MTLNNNIPAYVDPAVLQIGTLVVSVTDPDRTPLTVLRVEPMLVCVDPEGNGHIVYAHEVIPLDQQTEA